MSTTVSIQIGGPEIIVGMCYINMWFIDISQYVRVWQTSPYTFKRALKKTTVKHIGRALN